MIDQSTGKLQGTESQETFPFLAFYTPPISLAEALILSRNRGDYKAERERKKVKMMEKKAGWVGEKELAAKCMLGSFLQWEVVVMHCCPTETRYSHHFVLFSSLVTPSQHLKP